MKKIVLLIAFMPLVLSAQEDLKALTKKGIDHEKYIPKGLKVGDKAPRILATAVGGETIDSEQIIKEKNLIVLFYRGKWCPICNRYLNNLNDSLDYILEKNNAALVVVGPEAFKNAKETAGKAGGKFTLIPDTSLKILTDYDVLFHVTKNYQQKIKTFKMTDIAENNGQEEAILPVPATYIIGKDGKIIYRHFDFNYGNRASVKDIIDHLE